MSMSRLRALAIFCALMVLVGCGSQTDDGLSTSPSPAPTEPESSAPTDPSEPPSSSEPGTLVGIPEQGVEAGCWLLKGFLLLGGDEDLISSGQEIRVTGQVAKDVATTCQQGIPYRVDSATPTDS